MSRPSSQCTPHILHVHVCGHIMHISYMFMSHDHIHMSHVPINLHTCIMLCVIPLPRSAHHISHGLFSNSPLGLSPHSQPGSQSPDRRFSSSSFSGHGSPHHQAAHPSSPRSPPPGSDCPHPTRMNSLTHRSQPPSTSSLNPSNYSPGGNAPLTQPNATPPPPVPFQRTTSQPNVLFVGDKTSSHQHRHTIAAEERVRMSLRVSRLHMCILSMYINLA